MLSGTPGGAPPPAQTQMNQVSEHGMGGGYMPHPSAMPHAQQPVTMNGFGPGMQHQAPQHDANSFAVARLNQLKMMGINPWQAAGGHGPSGAAALWRQMSPLMGALIQGQHGGIQQGTQNAMQHFSPQVQALVQSVLARHAAAQGVDPAIQNGMNQQHNQYQGQHTAGF